MQITIRRTLSAAEEYIKIHDKITVLGSREKTVELLSEIVDRAENGDILFGHCRICTGYPPKILYTVINCSGKRCKISSSNSRKFRQMQKREKGYSLDVNAGDFAILEKENKLQ